jgi:hypothetical protein
MPRSNGNGTKIRIEDMVSDINELKEACRSIEIKLDNHITHIVCDVATLKAESRINRWLTTAVLGVLITTVVALLINAIVI